jgi:hypothetical protein
MNVIVCSELAVRDESEYAFKMFSKALDVMWAV